MTTAKTKKPLFNFDGSDSLKSPPTSPSACGPQATTTPRPAASVLSPFMPSPGDSSIIPYTSKTDDQAKTVTPTKTNDRSGTLTQDDVTIKNGNQVRTFSPTKAANAVLDNFILAMKKESDAIYYYNGQIFTPDGEDKIDYAILKVGGDLATGLMRRETLDRVRSELKQHPVVFDADPYLLAVSNGIIDLREKTRLPYKPDYCITDQLNVTYDQFATCDKFLKFLAEVAPNNQDQEMLLDWFAAYAIKVMFPYVMFLNGLGRNGKGLYEQVLQRFYGENSIREIPIERLTKDRFAPATLAGKRGLIVAEAGEEVEGKRSKKVIPTSFLKNVTGDGILDTEVKYKQERNQFKPFFKVIVDSNDMPIVNDQSRGWQERFCKADLPFHYVVHPDPNNPRERLKDPHLFDKITTQSELSGILNMVIDRAPRLIKTMTITKRSGAEMVTEYETQSRSVTTFLDTYCDCGMPSTGFVPMTSMNYTESDYLDSIYQKYVEWCQTSVADHVDVGRFGRAVKHFCEGTDPVKIRDVKGKLHRVYPNFRMDLNRFEGDMKKQNQ